MVSNQEKVGETIYEGKDSGKEVVLIVTDMQYPLTEGGRIDTEAGLKLIERMQKEKIDIPIVLCSSSNYQGIAGILGSVWYRETDNDLGWEFKEVLGRLL